MRKLEQHKNHNIILLPIILLISYVPLIVHQYQYSTNLSQFEWFPNGSENKNDFFLAWKMIAITIIGIVMLCILIYKLGRKHEKLRFENSFYFLYFYAIFVIMSALFSSYKYWVVRGSYDLFESIWVVGSYILLCIYTYQYVTNQEQLKSILRWSAIGVAVIVLIGIFQYIGLDLFKGSFGKHLVTYPSFWSQLDKMNFRLEDHVAYSTLYNPNFLSFYFGLLIPIIAGLIIAVTKIWQRMLLGILEVGCVVCLIAADSDSSWMALLLGIIIALLVLASRNKKIFLIMLSVIVVGMIGVGGICANTQIGKQIKTTILGTFKMHDIALWGFDTEDDYVALNIKGNILKVSYQVSEDQTMEIMCYDKNDTQLGLTMVNTEGSEYAVADKRFQDVTVKPVWYGDDTLAIAATIEDQIWGFVKQENEGYYYFNPANKLVKYHNIKNAELFREDAISSRGHIWNLTIPLLLKHIFIGSGANTFLFEYPQDDYIYGVYKAGVNVFDVKAHSWYLQQCIETGVIGTLLLIAFLMSYLIKSIRIYRRVNMHEQLSIAGYGVFVGILVYIIVALANDSNVCTAPVFWGILGIGFAINRMLCEKNNLFVRKIVETENDSQENLVKQTQKIETTKKLSRKQRKSKNAKK